MNNNLAEMLYRSRERSDNQIAQLYKSQGAWAHRSYTELWAAVAAIAAGLQALGVEAGDRVALLARTRPEWVIADYAIMSLGAVTVPVYPSLPRDAVSFILEDAGVSAAIVENEQQRMKVPATYLVVTIDGHPSESKSWLWVHETGMMNPIPHFEDRVLGIPRTQFATLVYTSGTTGRPKGAMLTHGNILANVEAFHDRTEQYPEIGVGPTDIALSFLPLSHILERMAHAFMLSQGVTIAYAESVDTLADDLKEVRPTLMVAVPRVFEKVYGRVLEQVDQGAASKRRIFWWAVACGRRAYAHLAAGRRVPWGLARQLALADRLVFRKVREALGGRLRFAISGGASLAQEIGEFFYALGVTVLEGYGLTETAPVLTVNQPNPPRYGSVGTPLSNVSLKIAEDGEILARGPNVMQGYWNLPEETDAVLADGWFHTGDIGQIDAEGNLYVTDRKKYLLVLSTGKNVAPAVVENQLILSPYIDQAVVVGDKRKYVGTLIWPNAAKVTEWAASRHIEPASFDDLLHHPDLYRFMMSEVARVTAPLSDFERPKRIRFLPHELTEASGELTPSLKVKVPVVLKRHAALIDDLYEHEEPAELRIPDNQQLQDEDFPSVQTTRASHSGIVDLLGSIALGAIVGLLLRVIL